MNAVDFYNNLDGICKASKLICRYLKDHPDDSFTDVQLTNIIGAPTDAFVPAALDYLVRNYVIEQLADLSYQAKQVTAENMRKIRNLYNSFYLTHHGYFIPDANPAVRRQNGRTARRQARGQRGAPPTPPRQNSPPLAAPWLPFNPPPNN